MDSSRIILCGHWGFYLEEAGEDKRVVMRIRGIRADGGWLVSSPVAEIHIMDFGLEAWTENPDEIYGLRVPGYGWWSLERFGLWGTERQEWANLAERLPGKLKVFAWMWQDPLCGYIEDWEWAGENIRKANEWKNRHKIEADSDCLCAIALCLAKAGQIRGWRNHRECPGILHPWDIFLCFHEDQTAFFENWFSWQNRKKWGYASVVIGEEKGPVICARSRWMMPHSLEILDISVSYRILGEDQIELEKAVYRRVDWEGTIKADGEGRISRRYIYICNTGEHSLFVGGLIKKTELLGNYFAGVDLEEVIEGVEGNEWNGTDFHE